MNALAFVVGLVRRLLLVFLVLFWVCVAWEFSKRGADGFRVWYYNTVYHNTLITPAKMGWRPVVIVLLGYFLFTAGLAVWEWRAIGGSRGASS